MQHQQVPDCLLGPVSGNGAMDEESCHGRKATNLAEEKEATERSGDTNPEEEHDKIEDCEWEERKREELEQAQVEIVALNTVHVKGVSQGMGAILTPATEGPSSLIVLITEELIQL